MYGLQRFECSTSTVLVGDGIRLIPEGYLCI
jgi:hypothetical protein